MIVGNILQLDRSRTELPEAIYKVLVRLRSLNFNLHPDGEMSEQGVVYKTFHANTALSITRMAETHRENIDVQFVISGAEILEYQPVLSRQPDDPHPGQDNDFYHGKTGNEKSLILYGGDFVVLFPWDIHTPLCQVEKTQSVRKVVAKVPLELIN
ncbi:YhcH/YjgK/YiaL family protein [Pectobacterium parmentieri]|uniref:YhcH/YjgK/YiaL family protein n=1 Tax=Pectobacterium parmentieri TaxID=1905730 RepID=UPI0013740C08|nr:YhcH/YjgK/YiaL family protein [Pectobacterium parmentieri]MBI0550241.1 DUF386 family protein [Pectobacterium parmentieri]MBI0558841.1 DUF386 family protein [Pectobacterium parmentieri]MBI0563427.1 DUF386 family protein [Pectobacterium parmentieri]QHQ16839.1 DUF386 family protein [Pectobacterium parmentieri]